MPHLPVTASFLSAATGGLLSQSHVDAGARCRLPDALGRSWFAGDARGFVSLPSYDAMHRPVAVTIARRGAGDPTVSARVGYGESLPQQETQALNLRGSVSEYFGQDGWDQVRGVSLLGQPCAALRYLACDYAGGEDGMPALAIPALEGSVPADAGLQSQGYSGAWPRTDALGRVLEFVNLSGNVLRTSYLASGFPDTVSADGISCLSSFAFNAKAQLLSMRVGTAESGGDGLFSAALRYDSRSYRILQRYASTDAARIAAAPGTGWIDGAGDAGRRQDMRFAFDPGGNVVDVQDAYPAIVFGADDSARSSYGYDALYRLLTASGLESAAASPIEGRTGTAIPAPATASGSAGQLLPYQQRYAYDDAGNITALAHYRDGSPSASRSAAMMVSSGSNRSIPASYYENLAGAAKTGAVDESFLANHGVFDACGNQLKNASLSAIAWNYENQATCAAYPGADGAVVTEYSVHSPGGARSRKVTETRNAQGLLTQLATVTYLGGVEWRASYIQADPEQGIGYDGETVTNAIPQTDYSELHIPLGHTQQLRILSCRLGAQGEAAGRTRYTLSDQIDSCQMELQADGSIANYQGFYPYGGTALSVAGDATGDDGARLKARQYSGEERDSTGLYAYGYRFFKPYEFCWLNPDPAGFEGSGLNWYQMVGGNPVSFRDEKGLTKFLMVEPKRGEGKAFPLKVHPLSDFRDLVSKRRDTAAGNTSLKFLLLENHEVHTASFVTLHMLFEKKVLPAKSDILIESWPPARMTPSFFRSRKKFFRNDVAYELEFYKKYRKRIGSAESLGHFLRVETGQASFPLWSDLVERYIFGPDRIIHPESPRKIYMRSIRAMRLDMDERLSPASAWTTRTKTIVVGLAHFFSLPTTWSAPYRDPGDPDTYRHMEIDFGLQNLPGNIAIVPFATAMAFWGRAYDAASNLGSLLNTARSEGYRAKLYEFSDQNEKTPCRTEDCTFVSLRNLASNDIYRMFFVLEPRR